MSPVPAKIPLVVEVVPSVGIQYLPKMGIYWVGVYEYIPSFARYWVASDKGRKP